MKNELISVYQKRRKRNRSKYEKSFSLFFVQNMTLQNANFCNDVFYVRFKIFSNNKQHSPIDSSRRIHVSNYPLRKGKIKIVLYLP